MVVITRTSLVRTILALSASWNSIVVSSSSSSIATTTTTTSTTTTDTPPLSVADPLLLRAARGEAVERTPVWMMRQAGRHMKAYRDLVPMYPTFRERSETPKVSLAISLQPFDACKLFRLVKGGKGRWNFRSLTVLAFVTHVRICYSLSVSKNFF